MGALNAMSHGTQDLYATFLQKQHGFSTGTTSLLAIVGAVGAIIGSTGFGAISERFGRRASVMFCCFLGVLLVPLWIFSTSIASLAGGVFLIQLCVQGCWGVIPAHLNELSPEEVRGTFPGFTYQLGNLLVAGIAQAEAILATENSAFKRPTELRIGNGNRRRGSLCLGFRARAHRLSRSQGDPGPSFASQPLSS